MVPIHFDGVWAREIPDDLSICWDELTCWRNKEAVRRQGQAQCCSGWWEAGQKTGRIRLQQWKCPGNFPVHPKSHEEANCSDWLNVGCIPLHATVQLPDIIKLEAGDHLGTISDYHLRAICPPASPKRAMQDADNMVWQTKWCEKTAAMGATKGCHVCVRDNLHRPAYYL